MATTTRSPKEAGPAGHCLERLTEEELLQRIDEVIAGRDKGDGALIPALQTAQNLCGYLPPCVLTHLSQRLAIPYSEVAGVVSFYSFFSTVPRGERLVRVCLGTACYVRGASDVLKAMKQTLGIEVGDTTPDRRFSLEVGRCFGACGLSPVVMVDENVHQRVKPAKVKELLAAYREEKQEAGR